MSRLRRAPVRYARTLERTLSELHGRPVVLSPRDWALVSDWSARSVPLAIVLEALREAVGRGRGRGRRSGAPSLASVARAVEQSFQAILDGRSSGAAASSADPLPSLADARAAWSRVGASAEASTELRDLIADLLKRLDGGEAPESIDGDLDAQLLGCVPPRLLAVAEAETDRALERYRSRMDPGALAATRRRGISDRLRMATGLPRLALTRRPPDRSPS